MKKIIMFCMLLGYFSSSKAQGNLDYPKGFDEAKEIDNARKKGIPETDIRGFVSSRKSDFIHHTAVEKEGGEEKLRKKVTFVNMTGESMDRAMTNYCANMDFTANNYSNWTGECTTTLSGGTLYPIATWNTTGINNNNGTPVFLNTNPYSLSSTASTDYHVVMNMPVGAYTTVQANAFNNGYDPVCQNPTTQYYDLPMVPPGGTHSLRLGSEYALYTSSEIIYMITVTASNTQFTYQFATVLNNSPSHLTGQQPAFVFQLLNNSNQQIGGSCGQYIKDGIGAATDSTFHKSISSYATGFDGDPVYYRKWHTATVDLTSYIGTTVYASFQTLDCIFSGHFGYAYISATCGNLTGTVAGFCGNTGTAVMNAPPGFATYQWYGPNSSTNIITGADSASHVANNALPNDSFFVQMVGLTGCTTKLKMIVTASHISLTTAASASCKGGNTGSGSVTVQGGSSSFNYTWTPSGVNTASVTNVAPGTYTVHVVDVTGHCPPKDTTIRVGAIPPPLQTVSQHFCGNTAVISAFPGTNYVWYNNNNSLISGATSITYTANGALNAQHFTTTYIDPTTHCEDSLVTSLIADTIKFAAISSAPCNGGSNGAIVLNANSTNSFSIYDWWVNGVQLGASATPPLIDQSLTSGTYSILVNPAGDPGCIFTMTVTLVQGQIPPPTTQTIKACPGDTTVMLAPAVLAGSTHSWYTGGSFISNAYPFPLGGNIVNNVIYTDTIRNTFGCKSVFKATLDAKGFTGNITSSEGIHCHNDSTGHLKANATAEINGPLGTTYTFNWTYPSPYSSPGTISTGTTAPQYSQESNLHAGIYTVTIKSGFCTNTYTYNLANPPLLQPDTFSAVFCPKDSIGMLIANPGHIKYTWLLNHQPNTTNPGYMNDTIYVLVPQISDYMVAYTKNGCKDTGEFRMDYPAYNAFIPKETVNIFTPNSDLHNDDFYPFFDPLLNQVEIYKQTDTYSIVIYDRWGRQIYDTNDYSKPWSGRNYHGVMQDDGTYYWIAKFQSNCATKAGLVTMKGYVQLLK